MYSLGCKCFSVVLGHWTHGSLLKKSSNTLIDRQTHWFKKLIPYANLTYIIYMKVILNEDGPVSRRPDYLPVDKLSMPYASLWWDGNVPNIDIIGK
jgi:hypothetical protein